MFGYYHDNNYNTKNDNKNNNNNDHDKYFIFLKLFFEQNLKGIAPFASPASFQFLHLVEYVQDFVPLHRGILLLNHTT